MFYLHDQSCNEETIRLKLFPFSLKDKAKTWLDSLRPRSIGTWQEIQTEFLKKFFPIHRTNALKRQIMNFHQKIMRHFINVGKDLKICLMLVHIMATKLGV